MTITAGWVTAIATVVGLLVTIAGFWIQSSFASRDAEINSAKGQQSLLFKKYDEFNSDLQKYKLYVAETYVNQAALEKLLLPIERRLDSIERDLRKDLHD